MREKLVASKYDDNMADKHLTTIQPMFKRSAVCSARLSEPVWPAAHALNQPESGASGEMSEPRFLIDRLLQVDHFSYHFFFYLRIISEYFLFTNTFNKAFTFFFFAVVVLIFFNSNTTRDGYVNQ